MSSNPLPDDDVLSPLDVAQVAGLDAVQALLMVEAKAWAARIAQLNELAALSERQQRAGVPQFRALELAGSWNVGQVTAERWLGEADRFATALPITLAMLETGALLCHQASVLLHRTSGCTPELARAVEAEVLPGGARLCPSDLGRRIDRVRLRLASEQTDPAEAEKQHAEQVARRRTFVRPDVDGMGLAGAVLPAEQLVGWAAGMDALERRERVADREAGIDRTSAQRRADIFAALPAMVLAGTVNDLAAAAAGEPAGPWTYGPGWLAAQIVFNVHVPVSTVLDLSREPGTVDRFGPVSAEHVRLLRPTSFRRVMVDALTGRPIAVDDRATPVDPDPASAREQVQAMLRPDVVVDADEPQHDPSARLARLVDIRDVRCAGPGCSSSRCDRDHLERYPDGPTSARNLGLLSPRCHQAKHHGWTLILHPDGSITWHSPLHRNYDRPSPHEPPPKIDLFAEPPPLRDIPTAAPPWDIRDSSLLDDLQPEPPEEAVEPAAPANDPDEPPPF